MQQTRHQIPISTELVSSERRWAAREERNRKSVSWRECEANTEVGSGDPECRGHFCWTAREAPVRGWGLRGYSRGGQSEECSRQKDGCTGPSWAAHSVRARSPYGTMVAGLIPGQGSHEYQPMNA